VHVAELFSNTDTADWVVPKFDPSSSITLCDDHRLHESDPPDASYTPTDVTAGANTDTVTVFDD